MIKISGPTIWLSAAYSCPWCG